MGPMHFAEDRERASERSDGLTATAEETGPEPRQRRGATEDWLPWAVSLLMHAGVVLLTGFIIWSSVSQSPDPHPPVSLNPGDEPQKPLEPL
jgi:hypothetical protein